jgi:hypothetical protein
MGLATEILRASNGVVLRKVTLPSRPGRPISIVFSVSSRRTYLVGQAESQSEAEKLFEEELARSASATPATWDPPPKK